MESNPLPAALVERRDKLTVQLAELDARIAARQRTIEAAEKRGEEAPANVYADLSAALHQSASTVGFIKDLERPSMVLLYEREEREKAGAFKPKEKGEGHVEVALEGPKGLEKKSREEIIWTLRKSRWTWQQIADWLMANGIKRPQGGDEWHTSAVYAIHKKGFSPSNA